MSYLNTKYPKKTSRPCQKCGKNLLLISVIIEKIDGQHGDITTSTYECSDPHCQEDTNKELVRMKKKKEERELINKKRLEKMHMNRRKSSKAIVAVSAT